VNDDSIAEGQASSIGSGVESGLRFHLPVYEGPLDLLLHLLKKNDLDPREVAASVITERYLDYIELLDSLNLELAGEYLVMAATLLLIKSFALLPEPHVPEGEDDPEDLKRDLVARLLEYQRYREAAQKLGDRAILGRDVFGSPGEPVEPASELEGPHEASVFELVEAMGAILRRIADQAPKRIVPRDIPIAHCIPRVLEALSCGERIELSALFEGYSDRPLVIATFIALLELIRQGEVRAWQDERSGPIFLTRGTPRIAASQPPGNAAVPPTLSDR
jgi:segregation and condensation protein A